MHKNLKLISGCVAAAMAFSIGAVSAHAADIVGLITKTEGNPFFVKMREGAQAKAKELGVTLQTYAGKFDGDNDSAGCRHRKPDRRRRQGLCHRAERLHRRSCRPSRRRATPA